MKLKDGFKIREVAGEYMLLPVGSVDMNCVFSMSESAAWLWRSLAGRVFEEEDAVSLILEEYEVDSVTALSDVREIIGLWRENGLIDG